MLNLAFPALTAVDGWLAQWLPLVLRVGLWGVLSGALAMGLYVLVSDQAGLARLKAATREMRRRSFDPSLDRSAYARLMRENLAVSFRLLGKSFGPAMLSSLPVLIVLAWLSVYHGFERPAVGASVPVTVLPGAAIEPASPANLTATADGLRLIITAAAEPVRFIDKGGVAYAGTPADPPMPLVHKRLWWNTILGNPAGYLRDDTAAEEIRFDFAVKELIGGVPGWMATWEFPYFIALIATALAIKFGLRIE